MVRVFNVINQTPPQNDYRILYARRSQVANVVFGLPGRPLTIQDSAFVHMGFSEGIGIADLAHFLRLLRYLWRHRTEYQMVHFFTTKLHLFGPLCARICGLPSIVTITGFGRTFNRSDLRYRLIRPVYVNLMRFSMYLAKAALFQNRGDMDWLSERLPGLKHKMFFIGSGADADVVNEKPFHDKPLYVLMVARLMPDKGVRVFVDAARRLHGQGLQFVLVGPESVGQKSLYQEVLQAHQEGVIDYRGELTGQDLAALYKECCVFVFPSRGEGMPRVMLEAGHAGMCPVASDIPAHRDLVKNGGGFLLAHNDELESLVKYLQRLEADRSELMRNAQAYQAHILKNYTVDAYVQRLDELFLELTSDTDGESAKVRRLAA